MLDFLVQNAATFAYLAAVATIISFVALFIFFAVGGVFGPINDAASVFQMLFLIPVALTLHQVFRQLNPTLSLTATIITILAMLGIAILQSLLIVQRVRFEQTLKPVLLLGGVIGLWWLVVGALAFSSDTFPAGFAWVSMLAGLSGVLLVVGFWMGGQQHPLAAIGFLVNAFASSIWAIWLGQLLSSSQILVTA